MGYKMEPIIGLAFVFECHGISEDTFYLCGSCSKTFTLKLMCQHMVSTEHQRNYMLQNYPQFMSWWGRDFSPEKKEVLLRDIASKISHRELYDKMDAQNISREKKLNSLFGYQKQLGMCIVECSCEKQTPFYLCVACGNSLSRGLVLLHIQATRHLQQYLSMRYPGCYDKVVCVGEVAVLADELLQLAGMLEERNLDEPSTMKRIPLPPEDFHSIRTMTFDKALSRLQTIYRNQSQSELLTCVTSKPQRGSSAGPVGCIGARTGALNTSNPHVENTATDPGALLPQKDPGSQAYLRLEQTQTGAKATLFSLLSEPATTVSTPPIGSTGPLAAHLGTAAYSSRSANIQSHSLTHNVTEKTPGVPGSKGSGTGQPYCPPPPYHANGYVNYATFSRPMAVYNTPHNPLLYPANGNHTAVGGPRGGQPNQSLQQSMFPQVVHLNSGLFATQLPIQRQYVSLPRGRQYSLWQSVAADTTHTGLPRAGTYTNNIVIANHNLPQSTSNLVVPGFQATTSYNFTSATPTAATGVMTSEGHPQGVAGFDLSNGTANGTN
ncbi:unnamed protein product [Merluccius merluccius]